MPLLWVLRDLLGLTGTKFGCGVAACGACTCWSTVRPCGPCVTPLASVAAQRVTTIEALGSAERPHALQKAWVLHQVPQCGYCQSGMLMAAAALLASQSAAERSRHRRAITNICRCGTYPRIRAAIRSAAEALRGSRSTAGARRTGARTEALKRRSRAAERPRPRRGAGRRLGPAAAAQPPRLGRHAGRRPRARSVSTAGCGSPPTAASSWR
jgi:isoquinoline 1-oxidoreductase alpha subunit